MSARLHDPSSLHPVYRVDRWLWRRGFVAGPVRTGARALILLAAALLTAGIVLLPLAAWPFLAGHGSPRFRPGIFTAWPSSCNMPFRPETTEGRPLPPPPPAARTIAPIQFETFHYRIFRVYGVSRFSRESVRAGGGIVRRRAYLTGFISIPV